MAMLQTIYFIFLLRCVCIVHTESNSILNILLSIKSYCHTQAMLLSSLSTLTVAPLCLASQFWAAMFQLTALLHPPTCPLTTLPLTLLRQPIITFDFDHLHHHYINPCALLPLVGGFFFSFLCAPSAGTLRLWLQVSDGDLESFSSLVLVAPLHILCDFDVSADIWVDEREAGGGREEEKRMLDNRQGANGSRDFSERLVRHTPSRPSCSLVCMCVCVCLCVWPRPVSLCLTPTSASHSQAAAVGAHAGSNWQMVCVVLRRFPPQH